MAPAIGLHWVEPHRLIATGAFGPRPESGPQGPALLLGGARCKSLTGRSGSGQVDPGRRAGGLPPAEGQTPRRSRAPSWSWGPAGRQATRTCPTVKVSRVAIFNIAHVLAWRLCRSLVRSVWRVTQVVSQVFV